MQKTIIVVLAISSIFAQSPATTFVPVRSSVDDYRTGVRYTNGSVDDLTYGRRYRYGNSFLPIAPGSSSNIDPNASNVIGVNGFNTTGFNGVTGINNINGGGSFLNAFGGINGVGVGSSPYTNYAVFPRDTVLGANGVYRGGVALEIDALNGFNTFGGVGSKYGVIQNNIANDYGYNGLYGLNSVGIITPEILNSNVVTTF